LLARRGKDTADSLYTWQLCRYTTQFIEMTDYYVIEATNCIKFTQEVNKYLSNGYKLVGGVFYGWNGVYLQAVVKKDKPRKQPDGFLEGGGGL